VEVRRNFGEHAWWTFIKPKSCSQLHRLLRQSLAVFDLGDCVLLALLLQMSSYVVLLRPFRIIVLRYPVLLMHNGTVQLDLYSENVS
jgi:hypothetical protein